MKPFQEYTDPDRHFTVKVYPHPDAIGGAIIEIEHNGGHLVREECRGIRGMGDALDID